MQDSKGIVERIREALKSRKFLDSEKRTADGKDGESKPDEKQKMKTS